MGHAPFFLMFGRVPRLPVDIMFKQVFCDPVVVDYDLCAKSLLSGLRNAIQIAQHHLSDEQQHQARQYNKRIKGTHLSFGDRKLVANKGGRGKKKLADKWENQVYTVVAVNPDIHVYKIKDVSGNAKVVHNLLLEVNFLPFPADMLALESVAGADSNNGSGQSDSVEEEAMDLLIENGGARLWFPSSGDQYNLYVGTGISWRRPPA